MVCRTYNQTDTDWDGGHTITKVWLLLRILETHCLVLWAEYDGDMLWYYNIHQNYLQMHWKMDG